MASKVFGGGHFHIILVYILMTSTTGVSALFHLRSICARTTRTTHDTARVTLGNLPSSYSVGDKAQLLWMNQDTFESLPRVADRSWGSPVAWVPCFWIVWLCSCGQWQQRPKAFIDTNLPICWKANLCGRESMCAGSAEVKGKVKGSQTYGVFFDIGMARHGKWDILKTVLTISWQFDIG